MNSQLNLPLLNRLTVAKGYQLLLTINFCRWLWTGDADWRLL